MTGFEVEKTRYPAGQNALDCIKRIDLEGLPNTRDLGGMPTCDGRRIRPGKLLRSGELFAMTRTDQDVLCREYHLEKIFDFRTRAERQERPDPELPGVTWMAVPILDEASIGITREKKTDGELLSAMLQQMQETGMTAERYMTRMYESFLRQETACQGYRVFFEQLLAGCDGAVLWHCTAGKDRVGIGTMLLLEALGVDRELIAADYLKTNVFTSKAREAQCAMARQHLGEEAAKIVRGIFSVKPEYLLAVYEEIERDYGSVAVFLENRLGLGTEAVEKLRQMYLM